MPEKAIPVEAEFTLFKKNMKGAKVRGATRYRCALATLGRLVLPDSDASCEVWINNLSKKGVGLSVEKPLDAGTAVVIQVKTPSGVFRIAGRVIHSTPQADSTWRIGCELLDELTPEMLDDLL
jgi:hypothetical protein